MTATVPSTATTRVAVSVRRKVVRDTITADDGGKGQEHAEKVKLKTALFPINKPNFSKDVMRKLITKN